MSGPPADVGAFLRRERELRGILLDDVAQRTRIKRSWLELIDAGRVDALPAPVFLRGFVLAYARAVGADETEASRLLARWLPDDAEARLSLPSRRCARWIDRGSLPLLSGVVLLFVAALVLLRLLVR